MGQVERGQDAILAEAPGGRREAITGRGGWDCGRGALAVSASQRLSGTPRGRWIWMAAEVHAASRPWRWSGIRCPALQKP